MKGGVDAAPAPYSGVRLDRGSPYKNQAAVVMTGPIELYGRAHLVQSG